MTTKLLALALVAGGAMFAQTRFSIGNNLGGDTRGYAAPSPPYAYSQQYTGYQAQGYQQPIYNNGYDTGYATQSYARRYSQTQHRTVDRDDDRDDHNRGFQRDRDDDHDRGHGYSQDDRQQSGYQKGFGNR